MACSPAPVDPDVVTPKLELPPLHQGVLAIVGVGVVPMTGPDPMHDQTLIVRDGIVEAVGSRDGTLVPPDAEVIDGTGLWVIPGLMDMHVHLRRADLDAYRRAGITTVRHMWGTPGGATLQAEAAQGADHPTIASASPGLDGPSPVWPGTIVVTDAEQARAQVRRLADEGWQFLKVYNSLRPGVYGAVLDEARELGLRVVGHVPFAVDLEQALTSGQATIEHLTGIAEEVAGHRGPAGWLTLRASRVVPVAQRVGRSNTWVCPTLVVLRQIARNVLPAAEATTVQQHQRAVIRELHRAGAPLLAGTDAGIDIVPAGASLVEELELFVAAGLSPYEALRTATADAARFLGLDGQLGTIEVGKRADLVLLSADPLADIRAAGTPLGVVQRGKRLF
jgi:imidazolonepropionase-like amidohydrolase